MAKVHVEFINTCPCCDEHGANIKNIAARFGDQIEVSLYSAGKDFGYLKKPAPIFYIDELSMQHSNCL